MKKLMIAALAATAMLSAGCAQLDRDVETFTVDSKERQCDGSSEGTTCYFVVYGTNGQVYTNTDDIFAGKFNSAEFQARLKVGETYTVRTTGWRIPILGLRPNITEIVAPATSGLSAHIVDAPDGSRYPTVTFSRIVAEPVTKPEDYETFGTLVLDTEGRPFLITDPEKPLSVESAETVAAINALLAQLVAPEEPAND